MSSMSSSNRSKKNTKFILLGDSGVGKTAIIQRFTHNKFQHRDNATIGIDFVGKNISVHGHTFRLQLWDTAGQERYRSLIPSYLKDAAAAIFVYDLTNIQSINNLQSWIQLYKQNKADKSILVLCGNKKDLVKQSSQNMDKEEKTKFIKQKYGMKHFEVSALLGQNVNQMFQITTEQLYKNQEKKKKKFDQTGDVLPFSSQNLHSDEMNSNRSNSTSNRNKFEKQKKIQESLQASSENTQNKAVTLKKDSNEVQGSNRCC